MDFHETRAVRAVAAIRQINTMGKVLQQRCNDKKATMRERCHEGRKERKKITHLYQKTPGLQEKASPKRNLLLEILPCGSQPLNEV